MQPSHNIRLNHLTCHPSPLLIPPTQVLNGVTPSSLGRICWQRYHQSSPVNLLEIVHGESKWISRKRACWVTQSCVILCDPMDCSPARLLCPWDFPGWNTAVGCHFLLLGIFPTQGSNPCLSLLLQGQATSLPLVPPGKARWGRMDIHTCICMAEALCYPPETTTTLLITYHFSSVAQSCPTLCNPMNHSTPGLPVHHQLPELAQTHVHWVGDAIQPSHPLLSPSPPVLNLSQHQGLFQWVNSSHQVAKGLEFQLQHQSFQWTPRDDFL